MTIAVCVKWINASGPQEADSTDERFAGMSYADQAALEYAIRLGEHRGEEVVVVTAGPIEAESVLRDALARGVQRAIRIDIDRSSDSATIASALSAVVGDCSTMWCGDYSMDRGSGSVPAFLAANLDIDQALGLIDIELPTDDTGSLRALRRLDGGRREELTIQGRAVLSVEGSTARLRRASLSATMAAKKSIIEVIKSAHSHGDQVTLRAYRPRARVIAAPVGHSALDRFKNITDSSSAKGHGETVVLEPSEAARLILHKLAEWGYRS